MPLEVSTENPTSIAQFLAVSTAKPAFLIVYASLLDGKSWCSDCQKAEPFVDAAFANHENSVKMVHVGQQYEWRSPRNPWRQEPFFVTKLPTIIKAVENKFERLVEGEVYNQEKLDTFLGRRS